MASLFVTFEGLDGSGKSTHLKWVGEELERRGLNITVTQEPGGTELGQAIRETFLDTRWGTIEGIVEALMIFASRRQHLLEVIDPALRSGRHVLCDRFTDSTFAYQGFGRGIPIAELETLDRLATGGREPDRTLVFDLPSRVARDRGQSLARKASSGGVDRLDAEALDFYEKVREGYLELVRRDPGRFRVIHSEGSLAETRRQVRAALEDLFPELG